MGNCYNAARYDTVSADLVKKVAPEEYDKFTSFLDLHDIELPTAAKWLEYTDDAVDEMSEEQHRECEEALPGLFNRLKDRVRCQTGRDLDLGYTPADLLSGSDAEECTAYFTVNAHIINPAVKRLNEDFGEDVRSLWAMW